MSTFYILSIDGGGYRGLFAAHILKRMEESWSINWQEHFRIFAGTSTGSIIAAGLAYGMNATKLSEFYETHGKAIFKKRCVSCLDFLKIFTSKYSHEYLRELLEIEFQGKTLGDITIPLIIPTVDIGNGCVHVLKSHYDPQFVRDTKVKLSDAVVASCSAPTYFDPHLVDEKYQLVDGGIWANNPSLVAVIDAHYRLKIPLADIRVLSLGTGKSRTFYPRSEGRLKDWFIRSWQGWGFASRWQRSKLIDLILNLQSDNAHNLLCLLFGESPINPTRVFRMNFESDNCLPMDSVSYGDDWITKADHCFTHSSPMLKKFLNLN